MTKEKFFEVFKPIQDRWKNSYTESMIDRIFLHVELLDKERFQIIVNQFLDGHRQAPLPRDFMDAAKVYLRKASVRDKPEYNYDCMHCLDGGLLALKSRAESHQTFCKCACIAGTKVPWNLPTWSQDMSQNYTQSPPSASDSGFISTLAGDLRVSQLNELKEAFKERMKIAEMYWGSNG